MLIFYNLFKKYLVNKVILMTILIVTFTFLYHSLCDEDDFQYTNLEEDNYNLFNTLYFTIATTSTLGDNSTSPKSNKCKILVFINILLMLWITFY